MRTGHNISRRSFLGLGLGGVLSALTGLEAQGAEPTGKARARRVLVLFEQGGVSHIDTWDPKPDAPAEHRSPFKPIRTKVDGVYFTELLRQTAQVADKLTVVRCMTQPTPGIGNSHPKGSQYVYSGEAPGGPVDYPDISSVVAHRMGTDALYLPSNILLPGTDEQAASSQVGFLPPGYAVFKTGGSPADPHWHVPNLSLLAGIDARRFQDRRDLLSALDVGYVNAGPSKDVQAMRALMAQAADMLTNPQTRRAFDLNTEPTAVRERYGLGHRGQCYLLARKLIEAGIRYVTVDVREPMNSFRDGKPVRYNGGSNMNWDHHDAIYSTSHTNIPNGGPGAGRYGIGTWPMMGSTDQALSALIEDMHQRGLLAETLVCFVTEFGRTPKINERQGRDHWTNAFSFAFAGAGVPGGQVVGSTDREGGYITSSMAYTLEDYAATIYEKLGIDRSKPLSTPTNRPIYLAARGRPIPELF
ncbi:MAG TPA: DUF1501 domain-containing protein [Chthonomonadaceae bacterium]|nr:DUF1501 domain-containing protein [Chthonomonadaceae bacterium]